MEFIEIIEYVNTQLTEGKSVKSIRNDLNMGEKLFLKLIKENGYRFNQKLKQYIVIQDNTTENKTIVLDDNTKLYSSQYNTIQANTVEYLTDNIEILKHIIDRFSNFQANTEANTEANTKSNTETNTIIINLIDDKHIKPNPKAVRINHFVYEEWQVFCDDNKLHSKQELISMALKEYMLNHKKI